MTNLSPLLDFLIAFVYIMAICSTLLSLSYELVSYWLRSRAFYLHKVLNDVLNDNKLNNLNLAELIYNFPQVDFTKRTYKDKPMYISANNFAKSLIHALNKYHLQQNMAVKPGGLVTVAPLPSHPVKLFTLAVAHLKPSDLKTLLDTFIKSSGGDFDKLTLNIETWYNDYMDRVTGWFKVRTQKRMIFIAIPVAIFFNLNFLNIGKSLYNDKASTAMIVSMVEKYKPLYGDTINSKEKLAAAIIEKDSILNVMQQANIPMGWKNPQHNPKSFPEWLLAIVGWLLMAAAMVMGAPFWYDLLNKLVNMRKAGLKPNSDTAKLSN